MSRCVVPGCPRRRRRLMYSCMQHVALPMAQLEKYFDAAAAAKTQRDRQRGRASSRKGLRPKLRKPKHAGGRPQAFIAAAVLAIAVQLHKDGRGWKGILEELERTENGRYARNTLKRRVLEAMSKTGRARAAAAARPPASTSRPKLKSYWPRPAGLEAYE